MLTLTPHQQQALDWLVAQLTTGHSPVALRGYAGSGKTTLIPVLRAALQAAGLPAVVGSPTHRAAMILRSKGIPDATTVHSHALTPYFKPEYSCAFNYLIPYADMPPCPSKLPEQIDLYYGPQGVPTLILEGLAKHTRSLGELRGIARRYGPRRALELLALHGRDYFDGFGPKEGDGVLIIDEASMVGQSMLDLCTQAFPLLCLVGDPGQLPPVKDAPALLDVPGVTLTEIHRQAAESPIIRLASAAREGTATYRQLVTVPGEVEELLAEEAACFLDAPLIVWRNAVRLNCTQAIRAALGYPAEAVVEGEPLVCRATSQEDRADGFCNNALYRVVATDEGGSDELLVQPLGDPDAAPLGVQAHLEEIHGESIAPGRVPFRFGYCLTAHTAQGGEWPTVYIAKPDLLAYLGKCQHSDNPRERDDGRKWAYTAITRAKQRLVFLQAYDFTQHQEVPTMPQMTVTQETLGPERVEAFLAPAPTDDIPDPVIPEAVQAALHPPGTGSVDPNTPAGQVVLTVDQALYQFSEHGAMVLTKFRDDAKQVLHGIDGAWKAILERLDTDNRALTCLKEALQTYAPCTPYSATVQAMSPSGFPMAFRVEHATFEGFMSAMGGLFQLLTSQGFTPGAAAGATGRSPLVGVGANTVEDDIPF